MTAEFSFQFIVTSDSKTGDHQTDLWHRFWSLLGFANVSWNKYVLCVDKDLENHYSRRDDWRHNAKEKMTVVIMKKKEE